MTQNACLVTSQNGPMSENAACDIVVMGVSGTGKTTVGSRLAERLGLPFAEGDDFHSDEARRKMASGTPLTDDDRWPWLRRLRGWMDIQNSSGGHGCVVSCSALRRAYRDVLRVSPGSVYFCDLEADEQTLRSRMTHRPGHYMPVSLLKSQLATLEPLQAGELGLSVPATGAPQETVAALYDWLAAHRAIPQEMPEPAQITPRA